MNLEKLIAKNMIRFGTKNLNEDVNPQLVGLVSTYIPAKDLTALDKMLAAAAKANTPQVLYAGTYCYFVCNRNTAQPDPKDPTAYYNYKISSYILGPRRYGDILLIDCAMADEADTGMTYRKDAKPNLTYLSDSTLTRDSKYPGWNNAWVGRVDGKYTPATAAAAVSKNFANLGTAAGAWVTSQASTNAMIKQWLTKATNNPATVTAVNAAKLTTGNAKLFYSGLTQSSPSTQTVPPVKQP